jgi:hypothetical protein
MRKVASQINSGIVILPLLIMQVQAQSENTEASQSLLAKGVSPLRVLVALLTSAKTDKPLLKKIRVMCCAS